MKCLIKAVYIKIMSLFQPHFIISSITNITAITTADATAIRAASTPPTIDPTLLASSAM